MAKILDKHGVSYFLTEIIDNANDFLGVVSPYISTSPAIRETFENCKAKKTFIFRKKDIKLEELSWIDGLQNGIKFFIQNLHSKCYISENAAIISSMNLYDWSQMFNHEIGIYVEKKDDPDLYHSIRKEYQKLISIGTSECVESIKFTYSNEGEKWRIVRLRDVAKIFLKKYGDVGIRRLHDHKGDLSIDWGHSVGQNFQIHRKSMEMIWEEIGELAMNVKHEII